LEEVRTDSARPKSAPNSDFLVMHLMYLAWIGIVPNSIILLVHISVYPKMDLIAKDDLFGEVWVPTASEFNQRTHGVVYGRLP